mmetsp:Transcript_4541/g.11421  ORF Transcript_4541/g.11421 Transcript_4541/m.11421 type:complete len:335 (+) Transcript_4541:900-1904(+)
MVRKMGYLKPQMDSRYLFRRITPMLLKYQAAIMPSENALMPAMSTPGMPPPPLCAPPVPDRAMPPGGESAPPLLPPGPAPPCRRMMPAEGGGRLKVPGARQTGGEGFEGGVSGGGGRRRRRRAFQHQRDPRPGERGVGGRQGQGDDRAEPAQGHARLPPRGDAGAQLAVRTLPRRRHELRVRRVRRPGAGVRGAVHAQGGRGDHPAAVQLRGQGRAARGSAPGADAVVRAPDPAAGQVPGAPRQVVRRGAVLALRAHDPRPPPGALPVEHGHRGRRGGGGGGGAPSRHHHVLQAPGHHLRRRGHQGVQPQGAAGGAGALPGVRGVLRPRVRGGG